MSQKEQSTNELISQLVREEIKALSSYPVPDASGLLKLDAMENPNPWPGEMMDEWLQHMRQVEANRYPDPTGRGVKAQLRELLELDRLESDHQRELDILLGNGSDELIQILAMALAQPGATVMAPEPGFVMYRMIAEFVGMNYQGVPLKEDFSLDIDAFLKQMAQLDPALIFLAVPNNPTGNCFDRADVESIIAAANGLVIIDEAYMAFTETDMLELCAVHSNVLVMRTLSKVGLAGLRLGFLLGDGRWLQELNKLRLPYNINVLTQASVEFALQHYPVLRAQTEEIKSERERLIAELQQLKGVEPFSSEANFVLVRCKGHSARATFNALKEAGVLIKCLDGGHPLLAECLRLTVGSPEQNDVLLEKLKRILP